MFKFGNRRKNKEGAKLAEEVRDAAIDMLFELMLNNPKMPEKRKVNFRIVKECEELVGKIANIAETFASPDPDGAASEKNYPLRSEVLEYIRLVSAGVDVFLESHPAPIVEVRTEKAI